MKPESMKNPIPVSGCSSQQNPVVLLFSWISCFPAEMPSAVRSLLNPEP